MRPFKIAFPSSVDQACDVAGDNFADARLLAGGSDLLTSIKERIEVPDLLVDLKRIKGLDGIAFDEKGITIGGLCTLSDVAAHEKVRKHYFALSEATEQAATPQIRNVATIAGNICQRPRCWYFRSEDYLCLKKGRERVPHHLRQRLLLRAEPVECRADTEGLRWDPGNRLDQRNPRGGDRGLFHGTHR